MTYDYAGVTVLDGSMGEELAERGFATYGGLWSASALLNHPQEVTALHAEYLNAGAQIVTTNTYSTVPSYLDKEGMGHRVKELARLAVQLARNALDDFSHSGSRRLAGCLPPLSESYRPDLVPPFHEAKPIYRDLITGMDGAVDLYIAETMSSIDEAVHVAEVLQEVSPAQSKPWFVSFTLDEAREASLHSGESVSEAIRAIKRYNPSAILFNCTTPSAILKGIKVARDVADCRVGGYPNRFKEVPEGWTLDGEQSIQRNVGLDIDAFVTWLDRFVRAGATVVGGCCGVGPSYIRAIAEYIGENRHELQEDPNSTRH